jgi:Ca2+-transporting ATPase
MSHDIVVGDLVILGGGDKIIADMIMLKNQGLIMDEASLTGESEPIKKSIADPWIRSGTMVREGSGTGLVVAVGINSEWGKTILLMEESEEEATPLQKKLEVVAELIGKVGFGVAISCFLAMLIQWLVINKGGSLDKINNHGPVQVCF